MIPNQLSLALLKRDGSGLVQNETQPSQPVGGKAGSKGTAENQERAPRLDRGATPVSAVRPGAKSGSGRNTRIPPPDAGRAPIPEQDAGERAQATSGIRPAAATDAEESSRSSAVRWRQRLAALEPAAISDYQRYLEQQDSQFTVFWTACKEANIDVGFVLFLALKAVPGSRPRPDGAIRAVARSLQKIIAWDDLPRAWKPGLQKTLDRVNSIPHPTSPLKPQPKKKRGHPLDSGTEPLSILRCAFETKEEHFWKAFKKKRSAYVPYVKMILEALHPGATYLKTFNSSFYGKLWGKGKTLKDVKSSWGAAYTEYTSLRMKPEGASEGESSVQGRRGGARQA